jgi:tripartite-type tricarboxylate transporter receptor subunit TctC
MFAAVSRIALVCAALLATSNALSATAFPTKFVKIVIASPPGGVQDQLSRQIGAALSAMWGQPVIVENKVGGGGLLAIEAVRQAPPDGYTVLMMDNYNLLTNNFLRTQKPQYDFDKVMTPVRSLVGIGNVLVANPKFPANTFEEFVAALKSPGPTLNYGSLGVGSAGHIEMEALLADLGLTMSHVPYKGGTGLASALLSGEVPIGFLGSTTAISFIRDGRLKGLSVFTDNRLPAIPNVRTLKESGVAYQPIYAWVGLWVPTGVPPDIVEKLSNDVNAVLSAPDFVTRNIEAYGLTVLNEPPDRLKDRMAAEVDVFAKRIRPLNIHLED